MRRRLLAILSACHVRLRPGLRRSPAPVAQRGALESPSRAMVVSDALTITTTRGKAESTLSVAGRIVIETSPRLRAALLEAIRVRLSPVLVIDMSGVSYLDTSGVATLLESLRLARARGVRLRVLGLTGEPEMLARILDMDLIFLALGSEVEFR